MAAVTPTEISYTDLPNSSDYGTFKRRIMVHLRYSSTAVDNTITLTTYIPEIADVETFLGTTVDGVDVGPGMTAHTWVAGVITTAGYTTGTEVWEQTLICTIT